MRERALAGTMPCQPGSQPKGWLGIWANASMRGQKWMGRKVSLSATTLVPYPTREETNGMVSHCEEAPDQCSVIEKAVQIVTPIEGHTPATCAQAPISILRSLRLHIGSHPRGRAYHFTVSLIPPTTFRSEMQTQMHR